MREILIEKFVFFDRVMIFFSRFLMYNSPGECFAPPLGISPRVSQVKRSPAVNNVYFFAETFKLLEIRPASF